MSKPRCNARTLAFGRPSSRCRNGAAHVRDRYDFCKLHARMWDEGKPFALCGRSCVRWVGGCACLEAQWYMPDDLADAVSDKLMEYAEARMHAAEVRGER